MMRQLDLTLLLSFTVYLCISRAQGSGTWYRGCYKAKRDFLHKPIAGNLSYCADICSDNGFYFVAVQLVSCHCLKTSEFVFQVEPESCKISCEGVNDKLSCGNTEQNLWSLYTTSGPYMELEESVFETKWIEPNIPMTLKSVVKFSEYIDITKESLIASEWKNSVEFTWYSEIGESKVNMTATGPRVEAFYTLTFPHPGTFVIDLKVRNVVSNIFKTIAVTVLVPNAPRAVHITQLNPDLTKPSCIPPSYQPNSYTPGLGRTKVTHIKSSHGPSSAPTVDPLIFTAFANASCLLDVTVDISEGVVFELSLKVWDGQQWEEFQIDDKDDVTFTPCDHPADSCMQAIATREFNVPGVYQGSATVSNSHGSVHRNFTIIIVDQRIHNATVVVDRPKSPVLVTTGSDVIRFNLTAVLTHRQSTYIRVDFRDGWVKTAGVVDAKDRSHVDPSIHALEGRYGNNCHFTFPFDHEYKVEGTFFPLVTLYNDVSSVTLEPATPIIAQHALVGLDIESEAFIQPNMVVRFNATLKNASVNASFVWSVFDEDGQSIFTKKAAPEAYMFITFPEVGVYNVMSNAFNMLGTLKTSKIVAVKRPMECLNVVVSPVPLAPLEILDGDPRGTSLQFEIDVGVGATFAPYGMKIIEGGSNVARNWSTSFSFDWEFETPGLHPMTFEAFNPISAVSRTIDVHSLDKPGPFKVQTLPAPMGFKIFVLRSENGDLLYREDLVYVFRFSDGTVNVTQVPVCSHQFGSSTQQQQQRTSGRRTTTHNTVHTPADTDAPASLEVTVENAGGQQQAVWNLSEKRGRRNTRRRKNQRRHRGRQVLWHPTFTDVGKSAQFLVTDAGPVKEISVNYSDRVIQNLSCRHDNCEWERQFSEPGVLELEVALYGRAGALGALRSVLVVQEPIQGLRLRGPTVAAVLDCDQDWEVELDSGSHVLYVWTLNGVSEPATTSRKFVKRFTLPGSHVLQVNATNEISQAEATTHFQIQYPKTILKNASVDIRPSKYGEPTEITLQVEGEKPFGITCDFGDGTFASCSSLDPYCVDVYRESDSHGFHLRFHSVLTHVYNDAGFYDVAVTVSSGLSTITRKGMAVVEKEPRGLELSVDGDCLQVGKEVQMQAHIKDGTNVSYTWDFGDGSTVYEGAPVQTYTYKRHLGVTKINVTAKNHVGLLRAQQIVQVVEKLQGVEFLWPEDMEMEANKDYTFSAEVIPASAEMFTPYKWRFYNRESGFVEKVGKSPKYRYPMTGRYIIEVGAENCLGHKVSTTVSILVTERLTGLHIVKKSNIVVNKSIEMQAHIFSGNFEANCTWDFGDGSPKVIGCNSVTHTYYRIGEFVVHLEAENPLSKGSATRKLFVLQVPCDPPEIVKLLPTGSSSEYMVSETIRMEAVVHINCSGSLAIGYEWNIISLATNTSATFKHHKRFKPLSFPELVIPPWALDPGQYLVTLKVEMQETEIPVYTTANANFTVVPSSLVSHIRGGIFHRLGAHKIIKLDGRGSRDIDNPSLELRYSWTCSPLEDRDSNCFKSDQTLPAMNESLLEISTDILNIPEASEYVEYIFNLSVSRSVDNQNVAKKDGRLEELLGREVNTSQVIGLDVHSNMIPLMVECVQCSQEMVIPNQKLSLRTYCPNCPKGKLSYYWELSVVMGEEEELPVNINCRYRNGPLQRIVLGSKNITEKSNAAKNATVVMEEGLQNGGSGRSLFPEGNPSTALNTRNLTKLIQIGKPRKIPHRDSKVKKPLGSDNSPPNIMDIFEGPGDPRTFDVPSINEEGPSRPRQFPYDNNKQPCVGPMCSAPDVLKPDSPPPPPPPHIISLPRTPVTLLEEYTLTGLDKPSLVIRPGLLQQGRTFFAQVKVVAQDGTRGESRVYFKVNKSPSKGKCSVKPQRGQSMNTTFSVFCHAWQDEHTPLRYEVSYSSLSSPGFEPTVIYHGLKHDIQFQLPTGRKEDDYKVLLHMAVLDRMGARTEVCSTPIEVRPAKESPVTSSSLPPVITLTNLREGVASDDDKDNEKADESIEDDEERVGPSVAERGNLTHDPDFLLLEQIRNESSFFLKWVEETVFHGVEHNLVWPAIQTAIALNSWHTRRHDGSAALSMRMVGRRNILRALAYLPLRDQVEVAQVLKCLVELTRIPEETSADLLPDLGTLLLRVTEETEDMFMSGAVSGFSHELDPQMMSLALEAVSNLLHSLSHHQSGFKRTQRLRGLFKDISEKAMKTLNSFLKMELQYHSIGEQPVLHKDSFISLNASHYSVRQMYSLELEGVEFSLPQNLNTSVYRNLRKKPAEEDAAPENTALSYSYRENEGCFQSRAFSFAKNPHSLQSGSQDLVLSELASLELYDCSGHEELRIQNLTPPDVIDIMIPRKKDTIAPDILQYLDKTQMNIHQLNISVPSKRYERSSEQDKYLHIHIQLKPVLQGRSFPILVIISTQLPPQNLQNFIFKKQYDAATNDIKISLPYDDFPVNRFSGIQYYVDLVEASFNAGRRRKNEIDGRFYTLNTWSGSCVYWNQSTDSWRTNGCEVMLDSNINLLHCQCNHLTTFGGVFELIPNDLTFASIDDFFRFHENPVVIIMVVLAVLIYVLLWTVVRQADIYDARKGSCVYLQDNMMSHRQKYEVVMQTGFCRDAGTTSKISIILHGEEGMSETRELISEDNKPMFERNSRDRFIVTFPESLGKIFKVQLWHNNSGSSPSWYLRQVVVRDLSAGTVYYFLCQRWLAVDRDDGKVEREFSVVDPSGMSFGKVFWYKGSQYLCDFHTWLSIWTCPPHSRFTRVQRLSVCLTLLLAYMCLNAMWFKQTPAQRRGEFGMLDLSLHNVLVGCMCCAILLPLNLILSFMFRRSRVHYPEYEDDKHLTSVKSTGDFASEGEEEVPHPVVTYSILDQSIINWQNIQDWAQKQWLKRQQSVRSSANSVKTTQTSPQLSAPSTTPLVQQTLLAEDDFDQASSGFEDATSQATAEKHRIKTTSDSSSADTKKSKNENSEISNASRRIFLPFWCRYVAWTLCILISAACSSLTILYGFRFGHIKSVMWLQSVYFSFMVCMFIAQPFLILLHVLSTAIKHKKNPAVFDHYDDGFYGKPVPYSCLTKQHSNLSEEEEEFVKGVAARSRSRYLRFAGPPQEKQLKSARKLFIKQRRALELLRDCLFFITLSILLGIITFGKETSPTYHLNSALKRAFFETGRNHTAFQKLENLGSWYSWSQTSFIETLYSQTSLGDDQMTPTLLGTMIGQVQVRQVQAVPSPCHTIPSLHWTRGHHCLTPGLDPSGSSSLWWFDTGERLELNPGLWGQSAWYDTSGHVFHLNLSREAATSQLESLQTEKWLNIKTKAIFVEFSLYNAPTNLFSSVTLLLETTESGQVFTSAHIRSTQVFRYITLWDNIVLACELLFIMAALWMCVHQIKKMVSMGQRYFFHFWNYVECAMSITSILFVSCYAYRFILVSEAVEFLRSTFYERFINLSFLTFWDEILRGLLGFLFLCAVLRLLRVLRYHQLFWRLQRVYRRSKKDLTLAAALYFGLIMAFSSLSSSLFGSVMFSFKCLWNSMLTISALSVRAVQWHDGDDDIVTQSSWFSVLLIFAFFFCHGLLVTYIVAALTYRMKKTRKLHVLRMSGNQLLLFYWDQILKWTGYRIEYSPIQTNETLPAEFTMAEILYLVEELLFRMNALLGTSGLPDKHHSFSDSDSTPNGGDDGISSGDSEDRAITTAIAVSSLPEAARLEQRVQKIEDKLCSHEPYLAQLLKLDSIGTDILSEEKEKELRSHLEFTIFRQLQMQRQETPYETEKQPAATPMDPLSTSASPDTKAVAAAALAAAAVVDAHDAMTCEATGATKMRPASTRVNNADAAIPKTYDYSSSGMDFSSDSCSPMKPLLLLPPKRSQSLKVPGKQGGRGQHGEIIKSHKQWLDLSTSNELTNEARMRANFVKAGNVQRAKHLHDRKEYDLWGSSEKKAKTDYFSRADTHGSKRSSVKGKDPRADSWSKTKERDYRKMEQGLAVCSTIVHPSSGNASPQSSESEHGHKRTDSSSGQSAHERSDTTKLMSTTNKRHELPPKPTFAHSMLPPYDLGKGWTPKPKQFTYMPELMNPIGAESSSGSEPEATLTTKRTAQGRRNLRKTKSRGKGKGNEESISPSMVLAADFASSGQSGGSDFDIIIHPVPMGIDPNDNTVPEE